MHHHQHTKKPLIDNFKPTNEQNDGEPDINTDEKGWQTPLVGILVKQVAQTKRDKQADKKSYLVHI